MDADKSIMGVHTFWYFCKMYNLSQCTDVIDTFFDHNILLWLNHLQNLIHHLLLKFHLRASSSSLGE